LVPAAEASYVSHVPEDSRRYLSSASLAGRQAGEARAGHLLVTHLMPGTDPAAAQAAAGAGFHGRVGIATASLVVDLA
jgi:ribonuclease BN (tRNA processing enzyme)